MSTEKLVKQQARAALRGNLSQLIAGAGVAAAVFLLWEFIEYFALNELGVQDTENILQSDQWFVVPVVVVFMALVLFSTPLLNGFLRMAASTAVRGKCDSLDVFYFFKTPMLFFKTVIINMLLMLLVTLSSAALNLSGWLSWAFPDYFGASPGLTAEFMLTALATVLTVLIRVMLYMLLAHYPLMRYALDENIGAGACVFGTLGFSLRRFGKLFKLALSFAVWFALCFFVVPVLYVLPYFAVAAVNSARWLLKMDGIGGEV